MPNHVENHLVITGDEAQLAALVALMKGEESAFDFNRILPMPECLKYTHSGANTINGERVEVWEEPEVPEGTEGAHKNFDGRWVKAQKVAPEELARRQREYGATHWYDWACNQWGTKWDAYDVGEWRLRGSWRASITFNTAWSDPRPVFDALAAKFPKLTFEVHCGGEVDEPYSYRIDPTDDD